jgi:hypothetical protein
MKLPLFAAMPDRFGLNRARLRDHEIFVLALITIAFEVYSDASLVSGDISHIAAPDPAEQLSPTGSDPGRASGSRGTERAWAPLPRGGAGA